MTEESKAPTLISEMTDTAEQIAAARRILAAEANRVEVRGYELCRLNRGGEWEVVIKYRNRHSALAQAKAACDYYNEKFPNSLCSVRVIVSAALPELPKREPLVLTADEQPSSTPNVTDAPQTFEELAARIEQHEANAG